MLIDGAAPPRRDDLPDVLAPLARRQAVRLDHTSFNATMTTLLAALERALATAATAPEPSSNVAPADRGTPTSTSPGRRSRLDRTTEDFLLLLRDRRPSARRIVAVLDELATQPEVEVPLSALAAAVGLSRGELRGAFAGLTFLCKQLRPGLECKQHRRVTDVGVVDQFVGKVLDLGADRGILYSFSGLTSGALARAKYALNPQILAVAWPPKEDHEYLSAQYSQDSLAAGIKIDPEYIDGLDVGGFAAFLEFGVWPTYGP